MARNHHKLRGFTLLEVVVVIAVMSILAMTATSAFQFEPTELELAQERLISDLHYTKTLAMTRGGRFGIFFEPASERYTVFQTSIATPILNPANQGQNLMVNYTNDTQFSSINLVSAAFGGTATILFDAQGIPLDENGNAIANAGTVVISNGGGAMTITVSPEVGRITGS